jgi:hypothetical protein
MAYPDLQLPNWQPCCEEPRRATGVVLLEATEPRRESSAVPSPVQAAAMSSVG